MVEPKTSLPVIFPRRKTYDAEARERVRSALLRYKNDHGIGVPTLQVRMAESTGRGEEFISRKTLQRFLAGSHRTNDAFIALCDQFLSGQLGYIGPDEATVKELAHKLGGFLRAVARGFLSRG